MAPPASVAAPAPVAIEDVHEEYSEAGELEVDALRYKRDSD
jgi:hypothetical protein